MNKIELDEIIRKHKLWLRTGGDYGARADLRGADLRDMDLYSADLRGANLSGADLSRADLSRAVLYRADLTGAIMTRTNLYRAHLSHANLSDAHLTAANLSDADLANADLADADLSNANIDGALNAPPYFSISWSGHGERGRRLHAVEQDESLVFSCGCFTGSADELRKYIKEGRDEYAASRTRALEIILELHRDCE